jgi:hypothetical protein
MRALIETEYQHSLHDALRSTTILYFLRGEMVAFEIPIHPDETDRLETWVFMDQLYYHQIPLEGKREVVCSEEEFEKAYRDCIGGSI